MSIIQQQNDLESFSDDMLVRESKTPTGRYPPFLVMTEMQRRKDLRERAKAQQYQPKPTVQDRLESEMMTGIVGADQQGAPAGNIPGMQMGIAGFANGGMVEGYQHGGPHYPPDDERRIYPDWMYQDHGLFGLAGKVIPRAAFGLGISSLADLYKITQFPDRYRPQQSQQSPRPPLLPNSPLRPGSQPSGMDPLTARIWQTWLNNMDISPDQEAPVEEEEAPVEETAPDYGLYAQTESALRPGFQRGMNALSARQKGAERDRDEYLKQLEALGPEYESKLDELSNMFRGAVEEGPSEIEQELQGLRRTPEQQRNEKIALALSGLGSLIATGEVGEGMGDLAREVIARGEDMRSEDIGIAMQVGSMAEARKQRNIDMMTRALEAEVSSVDVRRSIAQEAFAVNERIADRASRLEELRLNGELTIGAALAESRALEAQFKEAFRREQAALVLNPNVISQLVGSLSNALADPTLQFPGREQERQALIEERMKWVQVLSYLAARKWGGMSPEIKQLLEGQQGTTSPQREGFSFVNPTTLP